MGSTNIPFAPWQKRAASWLVRHAFTGNPCPGDAGFLPTRGIHRVLVSRTSHTLGNTLLITPLLRELSHVYPGAEIDLITRSPVASEVFGAFDHVRVLHRLPRHGFREPLRVTSILRRIGKQHYDLAIDPGLRSYSDRLFVSAANATWKLGYASTRGGRLNCEMPVPTELRHVGQLPVHLLRGALGGRVTGAYPRLDIALTPVEREWGAGVLREVVGDERRAIGVFTSATGNKDLGLDWWRRFILVVAKNRPDVHLVEIVAHDGRASFGTTIPTYFSTDLRRLAAVLSGFALFVSADCGVMHLACASGTDTVGLFRETDTLEWGPYGPRDLALEVASREPEAVAHMLPG